jgi:hypothetical protein
MSIFARAVAASRMTLQRRRPLVPLMIAGVAVIFFSTAGIAAIKGWRSAADGVGKSGVSQDSAEVRAPTAQSQLRTKARRLGRCAECGLVVSMGEVNSKDVNTADVSKRANRGEQSSNMATKHETVVRMTDGSSRVINGMSPASWRVGERVIVIAGTAPARR